MRFGAVSRNISNSSPTSVVYRGDFYKLTMKRGNSTGKYVMISTGLSVHNATVTPEVKNISFFLTYGAECAKILYFRLNGSKPLPLVW